jgi:DNA-binding MarR family transcriptional regulator
MPYERAHQIEQRFRRVIALIARDPLDAGKLAASLQVSRPTVHRIIAELRARGYIIRAVHDNQGWRYELVGSPPRKRDGDETWA